MIALIAIFWLSLFSFCHAAADPIPVREEAPSASVSVTITVDWLPLPYPTDPASTTSESSSSSWGGWGPSDTYSPPEASSSPSHSHDHTGGTCPPHTKSSSSSPTVTITVGPPTTLVTTRPITITTVTTELYSTISGETLSPSSTVDGPYYPVPTRTRCPHTNDAFACGNDDGGDTDDNAVEVWLRSGVSAEMMRQQELAVDDEGSHSSDEKANFMEGIEAALSSGGALTVTVRGSGLLSVLVLVAATVL